MAVSTQYPRDVDRILRQAIRERRLIRFWLDGHERIAEPHDYGLRRDAVHILVYQVRGGSKSGGIPDWRLVRLARATDFELLDERFEGGREVPSGDRTAWERVYLRVEPSAR